MNRLRILITAARTYYPASKSLQRQWVRKTKFLEDTGRHVKFNGGWVRL